MSCLLIMQEINDTPTPKKQIVISKDAPEALGPYSQAVIAGNFLFVSGQLAIDPKTGKMENEGIEGQTFRVLKNIEAILKETGLTFEHVVKCEIFMKDLSDFQIMNKIYWNFFSYPTKPARQTVQVAKLPLDALIEISCIAILPS